MRRLIIPLVAIGATLGLACVSSAFAANSSERQELHSATAASAAAGYRPIAKNAWINGGGIDFPPPYCSVMYAHGVHPITRVHGMGITNVSDATPDTSPSLEDFTAIVGDVETGEIVEISVKGTNVGQSVEGVKAYIDWNQDGIFDDRSEAYLIGYLQYSNGTDNRHVTAKFRVPNSAKTGTTRMRVVKAFDLMENPWSCNEGNSGWGQAEDYTLHVSAGASEAVFCGSFEAGEDGSCAMLPPSKNIVFSGQINLPVSPANGLGINFVTGVISSASDSGYDFGIAKGDPYLWGPGMYFIWGNGHNAGVASEQPRSYLVLGPGDTIGPTSTFINDGWGQTTAFLKYWDGMSGYLGVKFMNRDTGEVNYGYVHMLTTAGTGFPAMILDYAYDQSGAAITIP